MSTKIIECIDEREEILDKYAGIVKLGRTVKLKEILTLGEDRWQ